MNVSTELLARLQAKQERIRNMCIMAHVDHGKTTLSDHLIGSNGLIHPKLMGELRYLDSREDEQERGITIKSSSISLLYVPGSASRPEGPKSVTGAEMLSQGYLINLIDSPGHVDFCSEVSTAARLSDGALVVVDAVEGVCIQTHAVMRQAWEEKVTPCLFINKIDRLILELRMTPAEAYARFQSIVTHVNMIMSTFHSEKYLSEADAVLASETEVSAAAAAAADRQHSEGGAPGVDNRDEDDGADTFQPVVCNVAFGSAHDGWAFTLDQFATMYAEKLACKPAALQRALWGDYTFSVKDKRVVRIKGGAGADSKAKNMFVQFILEPLWKAYTVMDGEDVSSVLGTIVKGRGLGHLVPPKALEHPDPKQALRAVLRAWLPLSEAVLGMAVAQLPCPAAAAPRRIPRLLRATPGVLPESLSVALPPHVRDVLLRAEAALVCGSAAQDAPTVIYVSKMVAVPYSVLPRVAGEVVTGKQGDEVFLAFGRVYSGVAREGQRVHVLSAAYSPAAPDSIHRQTATITSLYMMMGRALERLKSVPAGCVLALGGLESCVLKSATVSSSPAVRPLAPMTFQAAPIVRVAVEPALPAEMPQLVEGLRLLNRADPFVEISVLESGEHVLGAAGEVHLETCVKDLKERFARIQLTVSPPLVAFRETVSCPEEATASDSGAMAGPGRPARVVESITPNTLLVVRVRAVAIPGAVASALEEHTDAVKLLLSTAQASQASTASAVTAAAGAAGDGAAGVVSGTGAFRSQMSSALSNANPRFATLAQQAWQLGPRGMGPNILLVPPPPPRPTSPAPTSTNLAAGLFDVPPANVVKAGRSVQGHHHNSHQQQQQSQQQSQQHQHQQPAQHRPDEADSQALAVATRRLVHLGRGGRPTVAAGLGLAAAAQPDSDQATSSGACLDTGAHARAANFRASVESGLISGFQIATGAGPLCEEPMWGVMFEVDVRIAVPGTGGSAGSSFSESATETDELLASLDLQEDIYGPFSGQVMTSMAAACRKAVSEADPRLAEAHYLCAVQASAEALSGVYAVLGKRRARILREEMREGSDTFLVHAYLPVEASFGLADDMRRRSSGAAAASLLLSHWERLQVDPFFVPTTEEEREEHGEEGVSSTASNVARRLIDVVRRRKGLAVEEKVVKVATKQRTLKRNV